jgi:DNA-binding MarR family transcriptional regulator
MVERRDQPDDRRSYALHLTQQGQQALAAIGTIARQHQEALCAALSGPEREALASLLLRIAEEQGLRRGVHPGYRLGRGARP